MWTSHDSLVLKILANKFSQVLPLSGSCTHIKGHGGLKATIQGVFDALPDHRFVIRTDVKSYYASIDHRILLNKLARHIKDRFVLNLFWQYLHRTIDYGGLYIDITQGISRGCSLSPIIGAFYLTELDSTFEGGNLYYVRYMDDILIMTKKHWALRRVVRRLNLQLNRLRLEKHPDKTFIGRIDKGFVFLGYHFSPYGLSVADITWTKFVARLHRLYEQKKASTDCDVVLGEYVRRWQRWASAGLHNKEQIIHTRWPNKTPRSGGVYNAITLS